MHSRCPQRQRRTAVSCSACQWQNSKAAAQATTTALTDIQASAACRSTTPQGGCVADGRDRHDEERKDRGDQQAARGVDQHPLTGEPARIGGRLPERTVAVALADGLHQRAVRHAPQRVEQAADLSGAQSHVLMWFCVFLEASMSRLTIDLSDQQHQSLKALAALQGKTIKQYALERLFPGDVDADRTWQELKAVLGARIDEGLADKVSAKSVGDIVDEELAGGRRV